MTKKKTIDLRSVDPTPVTAGDVNIIYNGTRIGGFSEDTEAVLKTGGCRVEQDIHVNYTKPSGAKYVPATFINETQDLNLWKCISWGTFLQIENGQIFVPNDLNDCNAIIPGDDSGIYYFSMIIESDTDVYDVTLNGVTIPYDENDMCYNVSIRSETYPTGPFNLSVRDKQH